MALDLYVNNERTENSSIMYRLVQPGYYETNIRLLDTDLDQTKDNISGNIIAEYKVNNGPEYRMRSKCTSFIQKLKLDSTVAQDYDISVTIKDALTLEVDRTYTMKVKFINAFPLADFVVYPKNVPYINAGTGDPDVRTLTEANYNTSPGTTFYGEGHTEEFNFLRLNALGNVVDETAALDTPVWLVGNPIHTIKLQSSIGEGFTDDDSFLPLTPINDRLKKTSIYTVPEDKSEYPISLFVYDGVDITPESPIITYDDATGEPSYYPFFYSTETIDGLPNPSNTILKNTIKVQTYPNATNFVELSSSLDHAPNYLPIDSSLWPFPSQLLYAAATSDPLITSTFVGSQWNTKGYNIYGEWGGEGDSLTTTSFLPFVSGYTFSLKYDDTQNGFLDYYTTSPTEETTVVVAVTATVQQVIQTSLINDWIPRQTTHIRYATMVIKPIPFGRKIYTPNYYNLINSSVSFEPITDATQSEFRIDNVTITSPNSPDTLVINSVPFHGTLSFDKLGKADISASFTTYHIPTDTSSTIYLTITDMVNVINSYDDVDERYYYTESSVPYTANKTKPFLSPNEWATADNVNGIIKQIYDAAALADASTYRYYPHHCLYGYLGLDGNPKALTWVDLECPTASEEMATWASRECYITEACTPISDEPPLNSRWSDHIGLDQNPNCIGEYCIMWKWGLEKKIFKQTCLTWDQVKCMEVNGEYGTKWKNDVPCDSFSELNCIRDTWRTCNIDKEYFPFNQCNSDTDRCDLVTTIPYQHENKLFFVYPKEVHLINNDYRATLQAVFTKSDETNFFQNIAGASTGKENDIFVLDSVLSRVTHLELVNNKFYIADTWGNFGYRESVTGLNNPNDIHRDQNNLIWIADTGNSCVKKFSFNGRFMGLFFHEDFEKDPPKSVCVDSAEKVHILLNKKVMVFDYDGKYEFQYSLTQEVTQSVKINTNYNRECVYITYGTGIVKYFRTGSYAYALINNHECSDGAILNEIRSAHQDEHRNVYITVGEQILKVNDLMRIEQTKAVVSDAQPIAAKSLSDILIHEEEYIQPRTYLKAFHSLWDVVETLRNSLFYEVEGCKKYVPAVYEKEQLVLGQNEIVTNMTINRLAGQVWENLATMFDYFDPNCNSKYISPIVQLKETCCGNITSDIPQEIKC